PDAEAARTPRAPRRRGAAGGPARAAHVRRRDWFHEGPGGGEFPAGLLPRGDNGRRAQQFLRLGLAPNHGRSPPAAGDHPGTPAGLVPGAHRLTGRLPDTPPTNRVWPVKACGCPRPSFLLLLALLQLPLLVLDGLL